MHFRTLELNLAQLSISIYKSKLNKYSDKRKEEYQNQLSELFGLLTKEDFSKLEGYQLVNKKKIIDFIFESIQYLDNSTLTVIPFEIVYCLEKALNKWIPDNSFIIVTSLSNKLLDYSISNNLAFNDPIYQLIENDYNVKFNHRLIQITLPRYYVHDYLANVVLYHELGHFIDMYYKVSNTIVGIIQQKTGVINDRATFNMYTHHYMEYFADLFAAQYIGNASNYFLNYIAHKAHATSTHPSTDDRIHVVTNFLDKVKDEKFKIIAKYTKERTDMDLRIRYKNLSLNAFYELIPHNINNEEDLHSIFVAGWEVWQKHPNKLVEKFDNSIAYKVINNLIEKSISNFIIVTNWKQQNAFIKKRAQKSNS